jgi:hypothetical protein
MQVKKGKEKEKTFGGKENGRWKEKGKTRTRKLVTQCTNAPVFSLRKF